MISIHFRGVSQRVLAPTAIAAAALTSAVLATTVLATTGLAAPAVAAVSRTGHWSAQAQVPKASSALAPAQHTSGAIWYVAYTTSAGGIDYVIHNGTWSATVRTVSGKNVAPATKLAPAITIFGGHLWIFWVNGSGQLRYTHRSGTTWVAAKTVSASSGGAPATSATPALTVASGTLWVAYKGHTTDNIYYTSTTGSAWNTQQKAVSDATGDAPTIAPTGLSAAPLAFAWTESSGSIGYGILSFIGFRTIGTVPSAGTNASPSLDFMTATKGDTMYLAWKGTHTNKVFYSDVTDFANTSFGPSSWGPQASLPDALTSTGPTLANSGTTLYAVYKALSSDNLLYESATAPTS
jgi:hypothetical protein